MVNIGSRYLLNMFMPFEIAVVLAYLAGMAAAYVLARMFVFEASGRSIASEVQRFTIVNLFALTLVWSISVATARIVFPSSLLQNSSNAANFPCVRGGGAAGAQAGAGLNWVTRDR